ncbi:hypothetical protein MLD38_032714 [Melastoma candidum]|uniref:Uncharacterized protein n=1 Tax=Melastoma candidum TaxID=119954 RepID=A0ACB9M6P6_9MYRT|nr:hypothetical protein MLD38_032714 [Melastoma candidum]
MEAADDLQSVRLRMESLRLSCDGQITANQRRLESLASSLLESMESVKARAQLGVQNQERLSKLRDGLKEAEDEFAKALSVKTRKEARLAKLGDAISAAKSRLEKLNRNVLEQKAARDRYASIISDDLLDLSVREKANKESSERKVEIQEAIAWYNKVLGLQIEGGSGVRFSFNNINKRSPEDFFSFTICHTNGIYSVLKCDLPVSGMVDMVEELNRSNDLYKFVRAMRAKFQEAEAERISSGVHSLPQESSFISVSAPCSSFSTVKTGSSSRRKELDKCDDDLHGNANKVNYGKGGGVAFPSSSPGSASSLRRSSRNASRK